jgi:riboflavin biosynthesis pyrimidine reductase
VRVLRAKVSGSGVRISDVLTQLAQEGVTRLLVEGGETIWQSFAAERLVDEVVLVQAGGDGKGEFAPAALAVRYAPGLDLSPSTRRRVGVDMLSMFRVVDLPRADVGRSA